MKNLSKGLLLMIAIVAFSGSYAQQVCESYIAPNSTSIDNVGNYGTALPSVTFNQGDFANGCVISDVDVVISWAKTDGTCSNPGSGNSNHQETSFSITGPNPGGTQILAVPGTWSGSATTGSVVTTFSNGSPIPSGTPVTGTFGPNGGSLASYNGQSAFGTWNLNVGDNGAGDPLCFQYYRVCITTTNDNTPPTFAALPDISVNADQGGCTTTVTWTPPTAQDDCGVTVTQTAGPSSGSLFSAASSPYTITYEAADPYGNTTTQSFTVTVVDAENPTITCPPDVFAGCDTVVAYAPPVAVDNCAGVTTNLLSGFPSGGVFPQGTTTVSYEATDVSGNTAQCSFDVLVDTESTDPTSITATATTACAGDAVQLTVNGGSLGTNAQWFWYIGSCGGQVVGVGSTITVNPLSTANYYVRAEGPCNESACTDILINVTAAPTVSFSNITSPTACGSADGTITAVAGGGTPPYTFTWSNGSVGPTISGLAAGPYEVLVTDANGCTDFSSVSLNDPGVSMVSLTSDDPDQIICAGDAVTFTASGAFQYQYYVNGIATSSQNPYLTDSLQDGDNVYVTGTDFNFCTYTTTALTFTVNELPIIDETINDPSACGVADGSILTTVSGGLPPYDYDWVSGQTAANISGLAAGPYVLTVEDDNACSTTETYALNDPGAQPVTLTSSEDPNNEICAGESVTFTGSGSVDYEFFVNGVSVGTTNPYTTTTLVNGESVVVTGTDASNCTATSNIIIPTVNPGPIIGLTVNDPDTTICAGQSISFFGSGALTYEFFVNGVSQGPAGPTTVFTSSSLADGDVVTVVGTDGNACDVESAAITVNVNASPSVTITNTSNPTACGASDGAITAAASGGTPNYTYTWSNGDVGPTVAFIPAGLYCVDVEDDAGCIATACAPLSDIGSSPVTLASSVSNDTICGGESVTFTGSGASTYVFFVNGIQVSTNNPFVTDSLIDGDNIAVMGLDTQLCAATSVPVEFTVHPEVQIGIVSQVNPSACGVSDGLANTITLGGTTPFSYLWTDGQITPNAVGLPAGPHGVTVTDANGCQSTDAVSLSDPGGFTVALTASPSDVIICDGDEIVFTAASGGTNSFEYFVSGVSVGTTNPYSTTSILDGQTVVAVGTDANSCTATSNSFTYQVLPTPAVTLTLPSHACSNDGSTLMTGGLPAGGDYVVNYGGNIMVGDLFFPEDAGVGATNVDYTYTATNGCSTTVSDDYVVLQAPQVDLGNDTTACAFTLDAGAGYISYNWSPTNETSQTIDVLTTGVYEVMVEDANGCLGMDQVGITVLPIQSPTVTPSGVVEFCAGDSVILTAAGGYVTYDWTTGSTSDTTIVYSSDTVVLTVTNTFGCAAEEEIIVIMNEPQMPPNVTADGPTEFCVGESVGLDAGPGYFSYLWNTGTTTQTLTATESGLYYVFVLDGNGCIDSSMVANPIEITVWDPEPIVSQSGDELTCTNVNEFTSIQWHLSPSTSSSGSPIPGATGAVHTADTSGYYRACVIDDEGCEGCSPWFELRGVGIEEANFNGEVSVYPNPNNGEITLEVEMQNEAELSVGLYDMVGKQVWMDSNLGQVTSLRKQYDLSQIPDGVYFIRIHADDQMIVQKLIKQQ